MVSTLVNHETGEWRLLPPQAKCSSDVLSACRHLFWRSKPKLSFGTQETQRSEFVCVLGVQARISLYHVVLTVVLTCTLALSAAVVDPPMPSPWNPDTNITKPSCIQVIAHDG